MKKALKAAKAAQVAKTTYIGNVVRGKAYGNRGSIHADLPNHGKCKVTKFVNGQAVVSFV